MSSMRSSSTDSGWKTRFAVYGAGILALIGAVGFSFNSSQGDPERFRVKVIAITMFDLETKPWLEREHLPRVIDVPTMADPVRCSTNGLCVAKVGEGKVNAAASLSAMLNDRRLDFSQAHFITSGVAGTSPQRGTLGFAAWADWVVDYDLGHHVSVQTDPNIPHGYLKGNPTGSNVYHLNETLVKEAYELTEHLHLADSAQAAETRSRYPGQKGRKPFVTRCDTVTGDNYWTGKDSSQTAEYIVEQWTGGHGEYCTAQQEDNATAGILRKHGHLDRYLSLRTGSDFDQPYPGQSATEVLNQSTGFTIAAENAYRVASKVAHHLLAA